MTGPGRLALAALATGALALAPARGRAQTMLDQEERLIDIHALLLELPPLEAPGALEPFQGSLGVEGVTIPSIDGQTGSKRQITASDRTPLFPRPRLALGLPAPGGLRAFVGLAAIPPFRIRDVSTSYGALEAGLAWVPGLLRAGVRLHALYAESRSPVTDPTTRDTLVTRGWGADASAGVRLRFPAAHLDAEPYAGAGVVQTRGRFRVTSDGTILRSTFTGASVVGGVRLVFRGRFEGVGELDAYPGRLVHTNFRLGILFP